MTPTPSSLQFQGFSQSVSGGSIALSGLVATVSADSGQYGFLEKRVYATPGQVVRMKIMARLVSGTRGRIRVFNSNGAGNTRYITSRDWREYEVSMGERLAGSGGLMVVGLGCYSGDVGQVEFALPRIEQQAGSIGVLRTAACGRVVFSGGTAALDNASQNAGLSVKSYSSGVLVLSTPVLPTSMKALPAVQSGHSPTNPTAVVRLSAYDPTTGDLTLLIVNSAGTPVDVGSDTDFSITAFLHI